MNHALLAELQELRCHPSITLLHTTSAGDAMRPADRAQLQDLVTEADRRLRAEDIADEVRESLVTKLRRLADAASAGRATRAIAICASPEHEAVVRLGRDVLTRVVVDETFATRDMVADANRTATFRLVALSERRSRLLVGDRDRLVEVQDLHWPIERTDDESAEAWRQRVDDAVDRELKSFDVPTVLAGVAHTVASMLDVDTIAPIGTVLGNHDETSHRALHDATWPIVDRWLGRDRQDAMARLDHARGARIFAGGIDEVWDLANDGRVELLVVEDDYHLAARVGGPHLRPADDRDDPDVTDDVVDELIEAVLRAGGDAVMVPPGELAEHDRLAAVLRY